MIYFVLPKYSLDNFKFLKIKSKFNIIGFNSLYNFYIGDVLSVSFRSKGYSFFFEGLCLGVKRRFFVDPETSFILRNVLDNIGIELIFSFFYNRIFFVKISDFKRKNFFYSKSKIFFIRNKLNLESRIA